MLNVFLVSHFALGYVEIEDWPDQIVIHPMLCSPHGSGDFDATDILSVDRDTVYEMPLPGSGMHQPGFLLVGHPGMCFYDGEIILSTHC